ncbi:MAG TPA: hypothetical protein PL037_09170 [Elusimicrobiales bacterium]|nr:hypothetical protein [Elusimicrobiales bacterium]
MKTLICLLITVAYTASLRAAGFDLQEVGASEIKSQWTDFDAPLAADAGYDQGLETLSGDDAEIPLARTSGSVSRFRKSAPRVGESLIGSKFEWARDQGAPIRGCMTPSERMAACGPIAAEAMLRFLEKDPELDKICDIWSTAKNKGTWKGAMQGPDWAGERGLLKAIGIEAELVWVTNLAAGERLLRESLEDGKAVIISTQRHYFFASGYNAGKIYVGYTGKIMGNYGGTAQMTLSEISSAGKGSLALLIPK